MKLLKLLIAIPLLISLGCVATQVQSYPTLANQGILPLSTNSAHVGANLFLARELEKSSYLFRFFERQGAPAAVEIQETQAHPPRMIMFYPRNKEVYIAQMRSDQRNRQWIITGPYSITRPDFRALKGMDLSFQGEPVFEIYGKPFRFKFNQTTRVARKVEPEIPAPAPKPKPAKKVVKKAPKKAASKDAVKPKLPDDDGINPREFTSLNSDQMAIAMSKGYAERNESGDIIHTVKSPVETMAAVATWYTGDDANAKKIATHNGFSSSKHKLAKGDRIVVQLKLLKRFKAMPTQ